MTRLSLLLPIAAAAASLAFAQNLPVPPVEGRYHYVSFTVKPGAAFQARTQTGLMTLAADKLRERKGARFVTDYPGGAPVALTATPSGAILAGGGAGSPELFIALRAPAEADTVRLAVGEWSAVAIALGASGKPRGLATAFVDFSVGPSGVPADWQVLSHEAGVDDVTRLDKAAVAKFASQPGGKGMMEIAAGASPLAGRHDLLLAASGDLFVAIPAAGPGIVIAIRRDRDANTMTLRGAYALTEIGARTSFAFAPDAARFFSTSGRIEASGGTAKLSQRVQPLGPPDRAIEFQGQLAYMVGPGGAGSLSPRLEQRRRNLALGDNLLISAQVAEAGQLSLVHGIGIAIRLLEPPRAGELAPRAVATGTTLSLYGRNLTPAAKGAAEGLQVIVDGQPAPVLLAAPNQINVGLGAPPAAGVKLKVEIEPPGQQRIGPVEVAVDAAPPGFDAAPATTGGIVAPAQAPRPGDAIELRLTGALPPAGAAILIDGQPASAASAAVPYRGKDPALVGTASIKVTIPSSVNPGPAVGVALATSDAYIDLGEIAIAPRPAPAAAAAAATAH